MGGKRESLKLLLICAIGIVAVGITGRHLYQSRIEFWKEEACNTFRVALMEELQKRSREEVYFYSKGNVDLSVMNANDRKKEPITVAMESKYGKKNFIIPYEKHIHNIERSSDLRGVRSYILKKNPLKADSLDIVWKGVLTRAGYSGKTVVRTSITDWWEHEASTYSADSSYVSKSDSLVTYYLGYRCEVGVTGYLYCPWWKVYSSRDRALLGALIVGCFLLFFMQEYVGRIYRRFFVKEIPLVVEKEVQVIIEKEVPVIAANKNQSHIYQLEDNLFFDADLRMLRKADVGVKLMPLSAKLLQGFLDAKDYRLSNNEIMDLLWPDGTGTSERLHTNIKRLRAYLSQVSAWIIENENLAYRLKNPHFIEENLL